MWEIHEFQEMLRDTKRFLTAYLIIDKPRPNTFTEYAASFRQLAVWMFQNNYRDFSQLDDDARESYFDYLCAKYYDEDCAIKVVSTTIDRQIGVITLLFKHRDRFIDIPNLQIALGELRNLEWSGVARKRGARAADKIPAVPEEVFRPMMREALCWVDEKSSDVIELLRMQEEAANRSLAWNSNNYTYYINRRLTGFQFKVLPMAAGPWRPDLAAVEYRQEADENGTTRNGLRPLSIIRELASHLIAACAIVIQGLTGIRVSELMGLEEEDDVPDGQWPSCIVVRPSIDGLNDVFLLRGKVFKGVHGEDDVGEVHWVVGLRPVGSSFIPPVVRAVQTLSLVVQGWRPLSSVRNIFLYPKMAGMPRAKNSAGSMLSETLRRIQQSFLENCVQLPIAFLGWPITSHQFRKKFAQDIVRCDPDAMPAIREHFKHVS
ncbi:hypothetical protein, partial [Agrobacterium cavarae]|uniref:hypothetical protein n=1 Tax=Agrobacterium cavarae TaxID=2528239 RepID=UPI0028A5DFF4